MKRKVVAIALLFLMSAALLFAVNPSVKGQTSGGLYIYEVTNQNSITPIENSTVGTPVTMVGTLYTTNGTFQVYFGDTLVDAGTADGYYVSSNFTIPQVPAGNYNLTLTDVAINQNYTYPFPILTAYSANAVVPPAPLQLQEGTNVALNVTITGGNASTAYGAEITVVPPSPVNENFTRMVSFTTSSLGTAQASITFPDSSFSPSGSNTLYAGTYTVYFNQSESLAKSTFTIGFTDSTQYHRGDVVKINAVGYQPSQTATLAIEFNNGVISSQSVTASNDGVITSSWSVPSNAAIGTYTVTITPQTSPSKTIPDTQTFQVPGYPVVFTTLNLASQAVPNIVVEAIDNATGNSYNATTYYDGTAAINLEKGAQTIYAFWNQVKVGETQVSITGNSSYTINCQLTDLKIKIQDTNGVAIPFTNLNISYQYVTQSGITHTGTVSGQTDLSGVYILNSTLPNISYTVNALKYGVVFNAENNTISNLPAVPTVQATILCPDEPLTLKIVNYNNAAVPNARITLIEQSSGVFYSATTDSNGNIQLQVTFGQYRLSVYSANNILLNETVLTVVNSTQSQIRCVLSNLEVSVKVVGYFGNPINNVNVQLIVPGMTTQTVVTKGDGIATFSNVLGGNVEVIAYPQGNQNSYVASNIQLTSPTTITLSMDKYVVLGGALIGTSTLATLLIIIVAIVLLIVVEVLRRVGIKNPLKKENRDAK